MKQVNFSHPGGFPLEQETLERLQTAYRTELYGAFKSHLGLKTNKNYIIAHATSAAKGWAVIHKDEKNLALPGILYPIKEGSNTGYLKTIQTGTSLIYGTGVSQTAYFDYEAIYISESQYLSRPTNPNNTDTSTVNYYNLGNVEDFEIIKDYKTIETDIDLINKSYLPLDGSKAMQGDLDLGSHLLTKLDVKESFASCVRVVDFRLGSKDRKGILNPTEPSGRALTDSSDQYKTSLSLNYQADWENTYIGGKVYLNNVNTSVEDFETSDHSENSLLLMDNLNQVMKSNNLLNSLLRRITDLEKKSGTPIGMIAIWGKPAPFPEGWEEYVPLRGRMPIGLNIADSDFTTIGDLGGSKSKKLEISEIPSHSHKFVSDNYNLGTGLRFGGNDGFQTGLVNQETETTGGDIPFSLMNPYRVVHFIEYTGRSLATTALTTPPNLIVQKVGATFVDLSWAPIYNDVGIANYLIYKNNILFATVNNIAFFTVNGLSRSSSYDFCVKAQDVAGNTSGESNTIRVKTNLL
ncbi:hypothetical protein [Flavobacterium sp. UBA7680]|uniref:hypothetical protein n=1 Tax=Flavobacterium sp. UBA7680 TaxID=1946559 RepID=UPI0025BF8A62|nr:hypothetical protein [Flavobacterium sp. UBA7680]